MGLAPGVVIKPIQVTIPKLGLPLELIAGKIQQMQGVKDAFDELKQMSPQALNLGKGDEQYLDKYNQYVSKLSESVANAFATGDSTKAMSMLNAAKSQLAREWKEGGLATALKSRSKAYQDQIVEFNKREVDNKTYTDVHKAVDFYDWKNSIGDIKFDIETGSYTPIGAIPKSTAVDVLDTAKKYADNLGIDKTAFVQALVDRSGFIQYGVGLNQQERVARSKILQQADSFLNDPLVARELITQQKYKNIQAGRADNPEMLIADARTVLENQNKSYTEAITKGKEFLNKTEEERIKDNSDYALATEEQRREFVETLTNDVSQYEKGVETIKTNIDSLDSNKAFSVLFNEETLARARSMFLNQFGVKDNFTNVKWFEGEEDGDNTNNKKLSQVSNQAIQILSETAERDMKEVLDKTEEINNSYVDAVSENVRDLKTLRDAYKGKFTQGEGYERDFFPVEEFITKDISKLQSSEKITTPEQKNELLLAQQEAFSKLTYALNIVNNTNLTDEQKKEQLASKFNLNDDNAAILYDDLTSESNKAAYVEITSKFNNANKQLNDINAIASIAYNNAGTALKESEKGVGNITKYPNSIGIEAKDRSFIISTSVEGSWYTNNEAIDDLMYAYDLVNQGVDITKVNDERITRLKSNLKEKIKVQEGKAYYHDYTPATLTNDVVRAMKDKSMDTIPTKVTLPQTDFVVGKPDTKQTKGINMLNETLDAVVKNYTDLKDYTTNISKQFTVEEDGSTLDAADIKGLVSSTDQSYTVGIDTIGTPYVKFKVKDKDDVTRTIKARLPENQKGKFIERLKQELEGLVLKTQQGEDRYDQVTTTIQTISKLDPQMYNTLVSSKLSDTHSNDKDKDIIPAQFVTILTTQGSQTGQLSLRKIFVGVTKVPKYQVVLKTDTEEKALDTFERNLQTTDNVYIDNYDAAINQYLLYYYSNLM